MKKINTGYWLCTGMIAFALSFGSVMDIMSTTVSLEVFEKLGYPTYLAPFFGVVRLLAIAVILMPVPNYQRLKEWAYAGITFDLSGAIYSNIALGNSLSTWIFLFLPAVFLAGSYIFYHKKLALVNG